MRLHELDTSAAIIYIFLLFSVLAHPLFIEIEVMVAGDHVFEFCIDGLDVLHSVLVGGEATDLSGVTAMGQNVAWRCEAAWGVWPGGVSVGDDKGVDSCRHGGYVLRDVIDEGLR